MLCVGAAIAVHCSSGWTKMPGAERVDSAKHGSESPPARDPRAALQRVAPAPLPAPASGDGTAVYGVGEDVERPGVGAQATDGDADELARMPLPDFGVLDPFEAVQLTRAEYRQLMKLIREGMQRQREIDRREQEGEITMDEHARLSAELAAEMETRIDGVLGADRAQIMAEVTSEWAKVAMPRVLGEAFRELERNARNAGGAP